MTEATLTRKIIQYLRCQGCLVLKWYGSPYGVGGIPDIYALIPASPYPIPCHIEVKMPGNTPTARQYAMLRALRNIGALAFWTDDMLDVHYMLTCVDGGKTAEEFLNEDFRIYRQGRSE